MTTMLIDAVLAATQLTIMKLHVAAAEALPDIN